MKNKKSIAKAVTMSMLPSANSDKKGGDNAEFMSPKDGPIANR